jgi:hypothetical protein
MWLFGKRLAAVANSLMLPILVPSVEMRLTGAGLLRSEALVRLRNNDRYYILSLIFDCQRFFRLLNKFFFAERQR